MHYIVRPVQIARRCWPMGDSSSTATMFCPLCALESHQTTEKTAQVARNGYIHCQSCDRFAAVYTADGNPVYPVSFDGNSTRRLAGALAELRTILGGGRDMLDMLSLDPAPVQVSFALDKIVLSAPVEDAEDDVRIPEATPKAPLLEVPPAVARILSRSTLSRFQSLPTTA